MSQQPEDLRRSGQVKESVNSWMSPVEGLTKRQGTHHLARVSTDYLTDALVHGIDRDGQEKYTALIGNESLAVHDRMGNSHDIIDGTNLVGTGSESRDFLDPDRWLEPDVTTGFLFRNRANNTADPDGGMSADLLSWENASANNKVTLSLDNDDFFSFAPYLVRIRAKKSDATSNFNVLVDMPNSGTMAVEVDLDTGAVIVDSTSMSRTLVTKIDRGFYLIEFVFTHGLLNAPGIGETTDITIQPSGSFLTGGGVRVDGSGGVWVHHLEVIKLLAADLSYLKIESDNVLTESKTFAAPDWSPVNAILPGTAAPKAPFGVGDYVTLQKTISGTQGIFAQSAGLFFDGPQMISCFVREGAAATASDSVVIGFSDTTAGVLHTASFAWSGGVLMRGDPTNDILDHGLVDHGHGNYEVWAVFDPAHSSLTASGNSRDVAVVVQDPAAASPKHMFAWGARLTNGAASIGDAPFQDAVKSLDAVTVQDTTFVSNSRITCKLSDSTAPGPDPDLDAFIFVQQAAYDTQYRVSLQHGDTTVIEHVQVADSVAPATADKAFDTYSLTITDRGSLPSADWAITVEGVVVNWRSSASAFQGSRAMSDMTRAAADAINNAMSANGKEVTASSFEDNIIIRATNRSLVLAPAFAVTPPLGSGGTFFGPVRTVSGGTTGTDVILDRADTSIIAEKLAGLLDNNNGVDASAKNSVIHIKITDGQMINNLEVADAVGNTYMKRIWREVAFFDELPTTCLDGYKIAVAGDPETGVDDYYVVFDADKPTEFGKGVWRETTARGTLDSLDGSTMPHQLIRRQDNSVGSYTGTANAIFFTWNRPDWSKRAVGSTELNRAPSFIDRTISGIFYWKSRLGFLSNESVILSEVSRHENFWRTTVRTLVDSDRIDVSSGTKDVAAFNHVSLSDQRIFLFSDLAVFELVGSPLTPRTAEIRQRLKERNSDRATPASLGRSLLFAYDNSQFTNIKEMFQVGEDVYDATEISAVVPSYIPGGARVLHASTVENFAIVLTNGDPGTAYIYKFFQSGQQRVQSAWSKWTFGDNTRILGISIIQSDILLYMERDGGVFLEKMTLGDGLKDPNSDFTLHMDRMINTDHPEVSSSYDGVGDETTFTIPYEMDAGEVYQAWTYQKDSVGAGLRIGATTTPTTTTLVGSGNLTGRDLVIGEQVRNDTTLSLPLRKEAQEGQSVVYLEGRLQALRAKFAYSASGRFIVTVKAGTRANIQHLFNNVHDGSTFDLEDGSFSLPLRANARELLIQLKNDQATPANFLSVEYIMEHSPRA